MPARRASRVLARQQIVGHSAGDTASAERLLDQVVEVVGKTSARRSVVVADLVVGANRVVTDLGRRARGCTLTPTVANATFAWSFAADGDRAATITVIGVAQPNAVMEFY